MDILFLYLLLFLNESVRSHERDDVGVNGATSAGLTNDSFEYSDNSDNKLPKFRKCCPLRSVKKGQKCVVNENLDLLYRDGLRINFLNEYIATVIVGEHFRLVTGRPCAFMYFEDDGELYFQKDGNLYIELPTSIPPWTVRTPDEYCLDTFVTEEDGVNKTRLDALVCFASQSGDSNYIISISCMLISCFFILLTVGVYSWLPELRNLHGRVLTAYLLSLFVGFTFLAAMQLLLTLHQITTDMCLIFTFIIYYSLLAAFFWLNVMCFDIWWTFSGKRGMALERLSTRGRFNAYAAYAFGVPTALTILLICLEFSGLPLHPYLPLIRHQGCFLFGHSKLLYLYGPIIVLCLANMTFFVLTALRIARIKQQTAVLQSRESATHDQHRGDKQRLLLYVKLFLVMGINWLLEVASALYPDAKEVWKYTDAYNVLIGFTIFVIFVCKKKIFRLMKKRYYHMKGVPMSRTQTTSTRTTSIREDLRLNSIKLNNN